jgi:hypothetical protein
MTKLLFAMLALAAVALTVVAIATARGPANAFAVGSGRSDAAFVGAEKLSFSAHNAPGPELCSATGHVTYSNPILSISADVTGLVIFLKPTGGDGGDAFISAIVTKTSNGFRVPVGTGVYFDVTDSGLPNGTADGFLFETPIPGGGTFCAPPVPTRPITSGNINIKAEATVGF